ncbi:hypothetical protein [Embleya sp. NPDC020630]|uniref:hypothetical protein n=1 Tax=Embleya sp. NPDC020630 TaxID=3363979 RepID=UPI0037A510C8
MVISSEVPVKYHRGIADPAVGGDRRRIVVQAAHLRHLGQSGHLAEHRLDPLSGRLGTQTGLVAQHDLEGVAGLGRGVCGEQVRRPLRLGARDGVVLVVIVTDRRGDTPGADENDQPQPYDELFVAMRKAGEAGEHPRSWGRGGSLFGERHGSSRIVSIGTGFAAMTRPACRM